MVGNVGNSFFAIDISNLTLYDITFFTLFSRNLKKNAE